MARSNLARKDDAEIVRFPAIIKVRQPIICPRCGGDARRPETEANFPFPSFGGGVSVVPGSLSYTSPGSYNFVVPPYNTMTVTVNGGGGGGGASGDFQNVCTGGGGGG